MTRPMRDTGKLTFQRSLTPVQVDQLVALFQAEWWTEGRVKEDVVKILESGGPIFAFIDSEFGELGRLCPRDDGWRL